MKSKKKNIRIGQFYSAGDKKRPWLLVCENTNQSLSSAINLVCLSNGENLTGRKVIAKNVYDITIKEFRTLCGKGSWYGEETFKRIKNPYSLPELR